MNKLPYFILLLGLGFCSLPLAAQNSQNTLTIKGEQKDVVLKWKASDAQNGKNYLIADDNEQHATIEAWRRENADKPAVVLNGKIAESDKKELEKLIKDGLAALGIKEDVNIQINSEEEE